MNLKDFWIEYQKAHSRYSTRLIHAIGTATAGLFICTGIANRIYFICVAGILLAYGLAWASHFYIEKNSPLSLKNPLFSLICDIRMCFLILTRQNPQ